MSLGSNTEAVIRRPSVLAAAGALACIALGAVAVTARDWPPTPAAREGRNLTRFIDSPSIADNRVAVTSVRDANAAGATRVVIGTDGRLLVSDPATGATFELAPDLPLTKPLIVTPDGVVAVSRGSAVFISTNGEHQLELGVATDVFVGSDGTLWLSHNDNGPQYLERISGREPGGERVLVGFGALVYGLADNGLLLGRSQSTEVVEPGSDEVKVQLRRFTTVFSVQRDVVVGTDSRCDSRRCSLAVIDASTGEGGEWELGSFRLPNKPSGEVSPDGSHLAMFLVDAQRNLFVGVINLATGELQRGQILGSSRSSADVSWARDGTAVYYVDPVESGIVRELRPFDETPSDIALPWRFGSITSVADLG
ncbi:MAG: hypothetical protein P8N50_05225 [Actinomycetota bacterium]|jgi:hypothetical protein|nr:hypothetical protein [Actinomycetota bacterium]